MLLENIQPEGQQRRWYEQDHGFARLLILIERMPQESMRLLGYRLLLNNARRARKQLADIQAYHPVEVVDGKDRLDPTLLRRHYDQDPVLKKVYDELYALPVQCMAAVGFNLAETLELLLTYAQSCKQVNQAPKADEILNMMRIGLYEGMRNAHVSLASYIGESLYKELIEQSSSKSLEGAEQPSV